mmetsp:Transcript_7097/g.26572  ORF Transcript_7097/g.26572 Transcript_7097/m.26572 type:complete len:95 (-) Transcript_7097:5-289(-)
MLETPMGLTFHDHYQLLYTVPHIICATTSSVAIPPCLRSNIFFIRGICALLVAYREETMDRLQKGEPKRASGLMRRAYILGILIHLTSGDGCIQ